MENVGFFTAGSIGNRFQAYTQSAIARIGSYLGGRTAHVINVNQALPVNANRSFALTCLKVAAYFTIGLVVVTVVLCCMRSSKRHHQLTHKPIDLSVIDTLGLDLTTEATVDASLFTWYAHQYIPAGPLTLKQAAEEVISKINAAVRKESFGDPKVPMQNRYRILLSTRAPWHTQDGRSNLYFYKCLVGNSFQPSSATLTGKSWLQCIIDALVDKNHIRYIKENGHGVFIEV